MLCGIDVGGTHTDAVLIGPEGVVACAKLPTNHDDLLASIREALSSIVAVAGPAAIDRLTREMKEAAKLLEFEHAAFLRDQIDRLRRGENPTADSSAEQERKQNHAQTQRRGRKYLGKR